MPFHTEQLKLSGLTDEQIEEAAASTLVSTGTSSLLHGMSYDHEKFLGELERIVKHIRSQMGIGAPV